MKKIISYKFILLILCPLMSVILSAIFLCMIPHNVFLLFVFAISLLCIGLLLYFEPVYYIINENEIKVIVELKDGDTETIGWGSDLTYDYVKINAEYRS